MAGIYSTGDFQAFLSSGSPAFEIVGISQSCYPKVYEISGSIAFLTTAQVTTLGVGVSLTPGVNVARSVPLIQEDIQLTTTFVKLNTDWGTGAPPTVPTQFYRRINLVGAAASNGQFIWRWQRGLGILPNTSLVIWCITSAVRGNMLNANVVIDS